MPFKLRKVTYKLYPTPKQATVLVRLLAAHQQLYNAALEERISAWRCARKNIRYEDQTKSLTYVREALPEDWAWMNCSSQQVTLRRLNKAFAAFFSRRKKGKSPGFPRFKGRGQFNSFTYREYGHGVAYLSPEYDHAMLVYILKIVRHFPADIMVRAYGSVATILELPFTAGVHANAVPYGIHDETVLKFYQAQIRLLNVLNGFGAVAVAGALVTISARSIRAAVALLLLLLYFGGYPAIQFHVRHYFHLEFIGWWALAFLADRGIQAAWRRRHLFRSVALFHVSSWSHLRPMAAHAGAFCLIALSLVIGPLVGLRWYQGVHVRSLLRDAYLGAEREPVDTISSATATGRVFVELPQLWRGRRADETLSTEYIVAEFSTRGCDAIQVPATFRYETKSSASDFSHDVAVRMFPGQPSTLVFFPAFRSAEWRTFKGIELPATDAGCLAGVFRVRTDRVPDVLLDVAFTPQWERAKLYQTLAGWETPSDGDVEQPRLYASPAWSSLRRGVEATTAFALIEPHLDYRHANVKDAASASVIIRGHPDTPTSAVIWLKDEWLPEGATVVAAGEVRTGGLALGILKDGKPAGDVRVTAPGPFVASVSVPAAGRYAIVISNRVDGGWLEDHIPTRFARLLAPFGLTRYNDVTLTTFGWWPPREPRRDSLPQAARG